jgi:hypothetical protein
VAYDRALSNQDLQAIRGHMEVAENSNWRIVQPGMIERALPNQTLRICGPDG